MKLGSVRYLIKEGFKGAWANRLMSFASIGVLVACMVVIGLAILISENISMAVGTLEKQNVVHIYLKDRAWSELYGEEAEKPATEETESQTSEENGEENTETDETKSEVAGENIEENTAENAEQNTQDGEQTTQKEIYYPIKNKEDAEQISAKISEWDNVEKAVVVTPEEGLAKMTADMTAEEKKTFEFLNEENPISYAIEVTMKDMDKFDETVEKLKSVKEVFNIQTYDGLAERLSFIKQGISVAGFWIIGILMVISLVIVSNTIRVTMYNRKLEISIMKAVGATNAFVRIPFVIEGLLIGIVSALISEGLIYFCYRVATEKIVEILGRVVPFEDVALYLLLVFTGIGVLAGAIGSIIIISKYLKREGSEFTAI